MRTLVTGAAGFIGSNVVDGLIQAGHEVIAVDNLSTGKRANVHPKAHFFLLDVRSPEMQRLIREERPDLIDHHAAQISVPASVEDPLSDADINIGGLLNILEGSVRYGVKKVIFISSGGAIYGDAPEFPTSEACLPIPLSPYAVAKCASELYLTYYRHLYGLDYTTLRYANVYGPRQIRQGEAGVVAIFVDNLLKGEPSVLNHFPEDAEGMIRDYCYVGDVVAANLLALDKGSGEAINIGTGKGTKTMDLYRTVFDAFCSVTGRDVSHLSIPSRNLARAGDIPRSCLRVEKALGVLGWRSATNLETGIRNTLAWRLGQASDFFA